MSLLRALVLMLCLSVAGQAAADYDKEGKAIFKTLMSHEQAFVRVSYVMVSSYMGQEETQQSSTTGVIVDPQGMILVPRMVVEPSLPNMSKLTPEQRVSFKMSARDFQIHFPGEDKPLDAEALTSDADQGVGWLKIKNLGDRKLKFVDVTQTESAEPGMSYYVVERLEERYGEKPIMSWGIIQGQIELPQQAHIVTGALGLAFSARGKVLGYVSANFEGMGNDSFSMTGGLRMLLTPAKRLHSANLRAASLLSEPAAP